jgi:antitoxin MazE
MRKNLTAIGSSLGLIIDKPIAELYQLDRNTVVEVTPKEDGLNIRFLKETAPRAADEEVMKAAKGINKRYNKMMKNLAK